MNVAIDVSPLYNRHSARGVGTYTKLLIEALQKYESKNSYTFFTRTQKIPNNIDLVHYPYFDPFFLTLPLFKFKPTVVTVHDLIPISYPDKFPRGLKGNIKWQIQSFSLKGARKIITDSRWSKGQISQLININPDRVDVVRLAPDPIFKRVTNTKLLTAIKKKYNLPDIFVLYVGDVNWNKNVLGLLKAIRGIVKLQSPQSKIEDTLFNKLKLVLVGEAFLDKNLSEVVEINDFIHSFNLRGHVTKVGFVPKVDLVGLYNLARVCVVPSFAEGFGLPVVEALACGCPVVASNIESLTEIGWSLIYVDPKNSLDIANGIVKALALEGKKPMATGTAWARNFSWRRVAEETVAVYDKAVHRYSK